VTSYVRCPYCRSLLDGALNPSGRADPQDWDPCVCAHCGNVSVFEFAADGGLRCPDAADWSAWENDPSLLLNIARTMHLIRTTTGGHR